MPRNSTLNKVNDLVRRARMVRVQALILAQLRSEMPRMGGRDRKQRELIGGLEEVFLKVMRAHGIPTGDFPDVNAFRHTLATSDSCRDFSKLPKMNEKVLAQLNALISNDVGALMERFAYPPPYPPP